MPAPFLFSVDLEDVRTMIPDGDRYAERVPQNVSQYLEFLADQDMHCTFFTVGDIARRYPELIREISGAGHEVACHGSEHIPLPRLDAESFRDDLRRNIDDLMAAGASAVRGFRAPVMSLTEQTPWVWEALVEQGIRYSSSVLPAANPMYGWAGFERDPSWREAGIWELPVTLSGLPGANWPFACGVYLRILPFPLVRMLSSRQQRRGQPLVMYCHPYDVDLEQERFMHPELGGNRALNALMYLGRRQVIPRLERLTAALGPTLPYVDYVSGLGTPA